MLGTLLEHVTSAKQALAEKPNMLQHAVFNNEAIMNLHGDHKMAYLCNWKRSLNKYSGLQRDSNP